MLEVIILTKFLISVGYYHTEHEIEALIYPLIIALDGKSDLTLEFEDKSPLPIMKALVAK